MKTIEVLIRDAERGLIKTFFASRVSFDNPKIISVMEHYLKDSGSRDILVCFVPGLNREVVVAQIWFEFRLIQIDEDGVPTKIEDRKRLRNVIYKFNYKFKNKKL